MDLKQMAMELIEAEEAVRPLERKFTARYPEFSPAEAYEIQRLARDEKVRRGRKVIGKKIGLTSRAMQKQFGIDQPDYGDLFDDRIFLAGAPIPARRFISPKVEGEIAFVLNKDLAGPGVTVADVLSATEGLLASIEIVDSRFGGGGQFADSIADNASLGGVVLGGKLVKPAGLDLRCLGMYMEKNGLLHSSGAAVEVMGNPFHAVAWLANKLAEHQEGLKAGDVILSGAVAGAVPAAPGDVLAVTFCQLGGIQLRFE